MTASAKTFQAIGEFIQIRPIEQKEESKNKVAVAEVQKAKPATGEVLSVGEGRYLSDGTFIKPPVKEGDVVLYNPHLVGYEHTETDGTVTLLVNTAAIYGRYQNT